MISTDNRFWRAACGGLLAALLLARPAGAAAALPAITADGPRLADPAGRTVVLKGCNLGNWLILESWMFGGTLRVDGRDFKDQAELFARLDDRFGRDKRERLMDAFRESFVTARDFEQVKAFGFNTVRLPFDYRLLLDDAAPGRLRPDAFRWLDHALALAEAAGVYVVLDLHGAPGGQSKQDHTGQADRNALWRDPLAQERTVALWAAIAARYKNRAVIAAYDLINEPYGDYRQDVRPVLATLMPRIAAAVRATGDRHVVLFPGALNGGIAFYGDPADRGLTNVGFTEHFYPGLFGSPPALETHARLLGAELPAKAAYLKTVNAPYLVGEFNVVPASQMPDRLMRSYYDRFAAYGWAGTMWSYKLLKREAGTAPGAWYAVTNGEALPTIDAATAGYEQIEAFFRGLATNRLAVREPLKAALTTAIAPELPLAKYTPFPAAAPTTPPSDPPGYASADVGVVAAGHTAARTGDVVEITAGGSDINGTADSLRFVAKPVAAASELRAVVTDFTDTNRYAKAGVMARWGDSPGAAMAMINVFPDGTLALMVRSSENASAVERRVHGVVALPVQLRLDVKAGKATASYRDARGPWTPAGVLDVPAGAFRLGVVACAHTDDALTTVRCVLGEAGDAALPTRVDRDRPPAGPSLLINGSFERPGDANNVAAGWNRWGEWIDRETRRTPAHDGDSVIGYRHDRIDGEPAGSGVWQDARAEPGRRYAFTVFARRDPAAAGKRDAASVELRLEGVGDGGPATLNTRTFAASDLPDGDGWARLSVSGTVVSGTVRALLVVTPAAGADRGGTVMFDDATLTPATDGR